MSIPSLRRTCWALAAAALVAGGSIVGPLAAADPETKPDSQAEQKKAEGLPLKKVVMFSSGMGFFEHRGQVKNDAQVDLKFNVQDINDLLKSMVLQDEGGGRISTVTYGSRDPVTKTLKTFAVDLTSNPTLGDVLNQARGERVQVNAPDAIGDVTGVILGIEKRTKEVRENKTVETEILNLLTDDGFRSVGLERVAQIKFLDPKLDAELRQALKILATGHATDKKTVSLSFLGQGERRVRVAYIRETPVWKTSYRLVLKDDDAPFLQGWAIVENTTDEDWDKVDLTLVSGRPISFIMDLYQPLYAQRPVVQPELYASLRPQSYDRDLGDSRSGIAIGGLEASTVAAPAAPMLREKLDRKGLVNKQENNFGFRSQEAINVEQGVQSQAQGADVGELFQYAIETPVTLPRQQSAMLPIVNESIKAEKVSIYNPSVQAKHPLNGLKLTNSTSLHLMQGPITVFDGGTYAGDAKADDLPPGAERLISYALDLDVEVAPEMKGSPERLLSVKLEKGVLTSENKYERTHRYVVKNSGKKEKTVLVEYPFDASWKLVAPEKPSEKTRAMYRFAVKAEPGKPATLDVQEEKIVRQQVAITNLDDSLIAIYRDSKVVSDKVKQSLAEVVKRTRALGETVSKREGLEKQAASIDQQQGRIRQNMGQLDRNSDLYRRYVTELSKQEDQLEKFQSQVEELQTQERSQQQALDQYLTDLDVS